MEVITIERLDKVLASQNVGSRKEVGALVRRGAVTVNGAVVKKADYKVDADRDAIEVNGQRVRFQKYVYIMMNKPMGVLSAARDERQKTVVDLLPPELRRRGLFPAGRLDRDTEGLLIITDDGDFAHRMLAPKSHVFKLYEAELDLPATPEDVTAFAQGLELDDMTCLPAELFLPENGARVRVRIREGKFHQVKRMFRAVGKTVVRLKRLQIGGLALDPALEPGQARPLDQEELASIFSEHLS
ncbi:pseudouridine synthase [Anaeromassilibacillus senegalensis]|uniref:pseudouridine synthase n=1 Tax=Anaeromassilibacillus senegalensis TaxID=1673717 RepID=UPI000AF6EC02|nr:pseudouridine synthase [Anaeromassilibacillus senegalensis]